MEFSTLNAMPNDQAEDTFRQCCAASDWVAGMAQARPYHSLDEVLASSDRIWSTMDENNWLEAFTAHPQIGNVDTLRAKFANTKALAAGEQSSVQQASEATIQALAKGNTDYLQKFGFIFIVCATGKSADEMLSMLQQRIVNDRQKELANAAAEQHKITTIRLKKLFATNA